MHAFLQTGYVESRGGGWKSAISTVECSIVIGKKESWRTDIRECVSAFLSLRLSHYIMSQYIQCSLFTDNPRLWLTRWSFIEFSSLHSNPFFFFLLFHTCPRFPCQLTPCITDKILTGFVSRTFCFQQLKKCLYEEPKGGVPSVCYTPPPYKGIIKHYIEKLSRATHCNL